ncbi:MAG: hypothetical protein NW224_00725 [Leptolyngbyaceae cyanobacterium bins.302]|nr:hypothetical protein [Leptolyngbyaceae cyanobacterium bins.302]
MAKRQTWIDQLNRYVFPLVVLAIGLYGTWDLIIQPYARIEQPLTTCSTNVIDVAVLKPSTNPNHPPKRVQAPEGLPIVVPAGEQRLLAITVDNPEQQSVMYQWQATHGQFASRVTVESQSAYTAPRNLVNDTVTVEATLQGCSPTKRTVDLAIVPSAKVPMTDQPLPETPALPSPTPSIPTTLPTIDPFAEPTR